MYVVSAPLVKEKPDMIHVKKHMVTKEEMKQETADEGGVSLAISHEGREISRKDKEISKDREDNTFLQQMYQEQMEAGRQQANEFENLAKLMEIARRIANADKVPAEDEKKLMEYSPDLYQMAKSAALINAHKKHKEYASLFEEENGSTEEKLRELKRKNSESIQSTPETDASDSAQSAQEETAG